MKQIKLNNKKIVISAAASGIGWSIAQSCMKQGAIVYISDKNSEELEKLSKNKLYKKQFFLEHVNANDSEQVNNYFNKLKKPIEKK